MYFTYILYSKHLDKFYIGSTADLKHRLIQHNSKHKGFTAASNDWVIVFFEKFNTRKEAQVREFQIKKWKSRKKIEQLISSAG